jgi:dipeptidyl aminopeptidase/acylaminoacyl peptidase
MKTLPIAGWFCLGLLLVTAILSARPAAAADNLIPRKLLFGNPDRAGVQLSPDGKHISFLAPVNGVMNVWVGPVDNPAAAKPVTADKKRGIRTYFWAFNNQNLLYLQDKDGDENWNVFAADSSGGEANNLTPNKDVAARIEGVSPKFPDEILVGLNDRDPKYHDVYRINIRTGEKKLLVQNPGEIESEAVTGILTDDDYHARLALTSTAEGGTGVYKPLPGTGDDGKFEWEYVDRVGMEDALTTTPVGWNKDNTALFISDSRDRDTAGLFSVDMGTGEKTLMAEDNRADLGEVLQHPTEKNVQAVSFNYDRHVWRVLDPAVQQDFDTLKKVADGDFSILSRTLDDSKWIVAYVMDDGPVRYYLYDHTARKATFLFTNRKALEGLPLVKMHPVVIKSRDGMDLVSYLSLPAIQTEGTVQDARGVAVPKPAEAVPLVLFVHGGPWGRDEWGLNPYHQWLANRGYAVLSVNFRGSTGLGKAFINAGNREWAAKMHDDLIDSVNWAVANGIARKDKVAIMGGSYGGYATLVGLTFTPDVFACGVDIVGPSRLATLLGTIPPYWAPMLAMFKARVGDHTTPEGREFLDSRSPLNFVDKIKRPLLIGQGANDPRVKQAEADQIVKAMEAKKLPVVYVLYPDEGHGFARPENRLSFNAVAEQFLAEHLGGKAEPIGGDLRGSSIKVPQGAGNIKGLSEALSAPDRG